VNWELVAVLAPYRRYVQSGMNADKTRALSYSIAFFYLSFLHLSFRYPEYIIREPFECWVACAAFRPDKNFGHLVNPPDGWQIPLPTGS
jgi:hypothetical protein